MGKPMMPSPIKATLLMGNLTGRIRAFRPAKPESNGTLHPGDAEEA